MADVERFSQVRARALQGSSALKDGYNQAIALVAQFRKQHMAIAHDYVLVPSGMRGGERGTGGTELEAFLETARRETSERSV